MKILIAVDWYYPAKKSGGPAVSISNLCKLLHNEWELYIITSDHDFGETIRFDSIKEGWNKVGKAKVLYLSEKEINERKINIVINELRPDVLFINSLFGYKFAIPLLRLSKKKNIPVWVAPRGELCKNAFNKAFKKLPYIWALKGYLKNNSTYYLSTSAEEHDAIKTIIHISDENKIIDVENIPTIPEEIVKLNTKKPGTLHCVFISRIQKKKNLLAAVSYVSQLKGDVTFDIYGPLEEPDYWAQCEEIIKKLPNTIKISHKGILPKEEVHKTLSDYDVMLFPTLSENYGHVIIESLLAKCPVVISDQTPWTQLEEYNAGYSIGLNDDKAFISILQKFVDMNNTEYGKYIEGCRRYTNNKLDIEDLHTKYLNALAMIVGR